MALTSKKPRKLIRLSELAKAIGCKTETAKKIVLANGMEIKKLSPAVNSPDFVFQAEAEKYLTNLGL